MKSLCGITELEQYIKINVSDDGIDLLIKFDEDIGLCFNINVDSIYDHFIEPIIEKGTDIPKYNIVMFSEHSIIAGNIWNGIHLIKCGQELKAGHLVAKTIAARKIKAVTIECMNLYCDCISYTDITVYKTAYVNSINCKNNKIKIKQLYAPCPAWQDE